MSEPIDNATDPDAGAQELADDAEAVQVADTPAAPDSAGQNGDFDLDDDDPADDDDAADADDQDDADTFPRTVVEKLRKENASYRDRAKAAEATVTALQRQSAEQRITAAGMKPEAVWAVSKLDDVLDGQGAVDPGKLAAAMDRARNTLGITQQRRYPSFKASSIGSSGATGSAMPRPRESFATAFAPKRDRD